MTGKTTQHILELSVEEQKKFLDSFDLVFFDCDGVIWPTLETIRNTGPSINLLKTAGKQCKFVSNNSLRTDAEYLEKFKSVGVENVEPEDVVYTTKVMVSYLKHHKPGEKVFSLCSLEANQVLKTNGIDFETQPYREHWRFPEYVSKVESNEKIGAVLIDYNIDLSYIGLSKANHYLLKDPNCMLIAGGADVMVPITKTFNAIGFIDFINHLSTNTNKEPVLMCRPSNALGEMLKRMFDIKQPERCLFIGDSLINDILFAKTCGFQTLYALTGTGKKELMLQAEGDAVPDYYADSLADFIEFFAKMENPKKSN